MACGLHRAAQKAPELSAFLLAMAPLSPRVVVEVGCGDGGTLYAWSKLNPRRLIGIDRRLPLALHGSEMILADHRDPDTLRRLEGLLGDDLIDLLFIDSDHDYEAVRGDVVMYGRLLAPRGVLAFHDICTPPNRPDFGVERLWRQVADVEKHEIITDPPTCGGIGWCRQHRSVHDSAAHCPAGLRHVGTC